MTLLKRTAGHLPDIFDLYRRLGLDGGITTQPLQQMPAYTACYSKDIAADMLDERETDDRLIDFYRRARRVQTERWSKGGFYGELMGNWRPASRRCPWLDRGLYVNREGAVAACCMIKDGKHALGRIGDPAEKILGARAAMCDELAKGKTPKACEGCEIARYAVMSPWSLVRRGVTVGLRTLKSIAVSSER